MRPAYPFFSVLAVTAHFMVLNSTCYSRFLLSQEVAAGERVVDSEGSVSTASSPSKKLEGDETVQQQPVWQAFKSRVRWHCSLVPL